MKPSADIIFINGSVVTVDSADQICEAVAVSGNRILHTGESKDVEKSAGPETKVIDLAGRSLLPGLIDAHVFLDISNIVEVFHRFIGIEQHAHIVGAGRIAGQHLLAA